MGWPPGKRWSTSSKLNCIDGFTAALEGKASFSPAQQAWLHAHRGAAHTLMFSMKPDAASFSQAKDDFTRARQLLNPYAWSLQFEAFLHAVRGEVGDFEVARSLLRQIKTDDSMTQSSLNRSLAMLYSYDQETDAAKESVRKGLEAVRLDPEDCTAAYFSAASLHFLNKRRVVSEELFTSALESARVRAMNAISQASALLAGIGILQGDDSIAREFLDRLVKPATSELDIRPDLETLAMISRDPTWAPLRGHTAFKQLMEKGAPRPYAWNAESRLEAARKALSAAART